GVGPRGAEDRTAVQINAADFFDRQSAGVLLRIELARLKDGVAVAVIEADHFHAVVTRLDGDGADHAVDAGGRAAADQERELAVRGGVCHRLVSLRRVIGRPYRGWLGQAGANNY